MPIDEHTGRARTSLHQLFRRATYGFGALVAVVAMASCTTQAPQAAASRGSALDERQRTAMAMFAERCKKAGEFIHRRVDNVEGIALLKVRPTRLNRDDQFALDDPYGSDLGGDDYIRSFLRIEDAQPGQRSFAQNGYHYAEAVDLADGKTYRYTASVAEVTRVHSVMSGGDGKSTFVTRDIVLHRVLAVEPRAVYGVTYEDISTPEERSYWIAGSSLRVVDLRTNEVLAERVGYLLDIFQGSTTGNRAPWLWALDNACPALVTPQQRRNGPAFAASIGRTARFVRNTLVPSSK